MNRHLVVTLSLCLIVLLSACSAKKEGSITILATGNVQTLAAPSSPANIGPAVLDDRQQLANYQATLPHFAIPASAAQWANGAEFERLDDRQQLADYQATLPHFMVEPAPSGIAAK
jgi:hypothetical protein